MVSLRRWVCSRQWLVSYHFTTGHKVSHKVAKNPELGPKVCVVRKTVSGVEKEDALLTQLLVSGCPDVPEVRANVADCIVITLMQQIIEVV